MRDRVCDHCGRWVEDSETLYEMIVSLRAEPSPTISLEEAEQPDLLEEMRRLVDAMEQMTPEQVEEATDQVFEEHHFLLCPQCRHETHAWLKQRRKIIGS